MDGGMHAAPERQAAGRSSKTCSNSNMMRFCDVGFRELVRDPKAVIRQIYAHFGYGEDGKLSAEFEAAIDAFMAENPRCG